MGLWKMWMEMQSGDSLVPITVLIPVQVLKDQDCHKTFGCWFVPSAFKVGSAQ